LPFFHWLSIGSTAAAAKEGAGSHQLLDRDMLMPKRFEEAYLKHTLLEICHEMCSETTQTLDLTMDIDILIDLVSRGATSLVVTNPPKVI
jgi:hypothetical protein